jgi:hypothetical protein
LLTKGKKIITCFCGHWFIVIVEQEKRIDDVIVSGGPSQPTLGVATFFWLKSRNLRFFSGGVKKFPDFVEQKKINF